MNPDPESPTPTPITDAEVLSFNAHADSLGIFEVVPADFARTIEREVLTAQSEVQQLRDRITELGLELEAQEIREVCAKCGRPWNPSLVQGSVCIFCIEKIRTEERDTALARITELEQQVAEHQKERANMDRFTLRLIAVGNRLGDDDPLTATLSALTEEMESLRAELEACTKERDLAIMEVGKYAGEAGRAQGKLAGSNWPVIAQWKERAEKAEKERDNYAAKIMSDEEDSEIQNEKAEKIFVALTQQLTQSQADCAALREGLEKCVFVIEFHLGETVRGASKDWWSKITALLSTPNPGAALLEDRERLNWLDRNKVTLKEVEFVPSRLLPSGHILIVSTGSFRRSIDEARAAMAAEKGKATNTP